MKKTILALSTILSTQAMATETTLVANQKGTLDLSYAKMACVDMPGFGTTLVVKPLYSSSGFTSQYSTNVTKFFGPVGGTIAECKAMIKQVKQQASLSQTFTRQTAGAEYGNCAESTKESASLTVAAGRGITLLQGEALFLVGQLDKSACK